MHSSIGIVKSLAKQLIYKLPPKILNQSPIGMPIKQNHWSIGIYVGESPFNFVSPKTAKNPVLTRKSVSDVYAAFVADPFMIEADNIWYMFFEVLNNLTGKGEIGLAISQDRINWQYQQIVLAEPVHLSYPYVFKWMGEYYMVPESCQAKSIRLYKAAKFPTQWSFVGDILSGSIFIDPSLFRYADKWWLFTETNPNHKYDTLRLYYADELMGTWFEHPDSPIVKGNAHIARPSGRVLVMNDRLIRYTQDCDPEYGIQVRAFEITELTTTSYREQEIERDLVLKPSGVGWNGSGMHHIDPHLLDNGTWIACVDGRIR
jgi:hypothetical protein